MLLYLPRKLFFMSSIRVLALKIVLTWNLFSWFIYFGRVLTFQLLIPSSRCFTFDLELPALFILFLKSLSIASVTLFFRWCFVVSFFSSAVPSGSGAFQMPTCPSSSSSSSSSSATSSASTLRGGRANLRNASVTFSLFWHEASLGWH